MSWDCGAGSPIAWRSSAAFCSVRGSGSAVELVVRDTGVGIPASELPRVFERFHRIEGQRGRTHEGTSIGLALVEELVKLHGGTIDVDVSSAETGVITLAVTDEGIGVSSEHREHIFERFYRVDPARSRATGGTGLGLAIVKHVTAAHGGQVTVESTEGAGSTFTLRLPLRPDAVTFSGGTVPAMARSARRQ